MDCALFLDLQNWNFFIIDIQNGPRVSSEASEDDCVLDNFGMLRELWQNSNLSNQPERSTLNCQFHPFLHSHAKFHELLAAS